MSELKHLEELIIGDEKERHRLKYQYSDCKGRYLGWLVTGIFRQENVYKYLIANDGKELLERLSNEHPQILEHFHILYMNAQTNVYAFNDMMMRAFYDFAVENDLLKGSVFDNE